MDVISVTAKGDGRALALKFCAGHCQYCIINVYSPTRASDKDKFYKGLILWVKKLDISKSELIFGGDWNCVQNPRLDTQGVSFPYKSKKWFLTFIKKYNLIDIWRLIHQTKKQFTWRQMSLGLFSRLDYWLISPSLQYAVQNTDIRPAIRCDHNAISLKFKTSDNARGRGFWKLNNSLLYDKLFQECIIRIVNKVRLEYAQLCPQLKWEMCKIKIREFSLKYSKQKRKLQNIFFRNYSKITLCLIEELMKTLVKKIYKNYRKQESN